MKIRHAIVILIIIALAGAAFIFLRLNREPETVYATAVAEIGSLVQTVSETGTVKAESELSLSFLNSGRVAKIYYSIGDEVKAGDLLAELDHADLDIKRLEMLAGLQASQANLNRIHSGASQEEIAFARAGLDQARSAYEAAKREMEKTKQSAAETLEQAEKTLKDLESTSDASITPREQAVIIARTNLENTRSIYQKAIDDAVLASVVTAEDKNAAAMPALDAVAGVLDDEDLKYSFSVRKTEYAAKTVAELDAAKALALLAQSALDAAKASSSAASALLAVRKSNDYLSKAFSALNNCYSGLENTAVSYNFTQTELDAHKAGISSQQALIAAAITAVVAKDQALQSAVLNYDTKIAEFEAAYASAQTNYEQALIDARFAYNNAKIGGEQQLAAAESRVDNAYETWLVAQAQLERVLAPAGKYEVNLAEAQIRQSQASLLAIDNQIEKSKIFAPIAGIITASRYKEGELVSAAGAPAFSLLGKNDYEIELLVSEADIAKVKAEDKATITLDAYGEDIFFAGLIFFIEPAETEVQDVVYYKVKLSFDPQGYMVKSGMTANVVITTEEKEGVLLVPARAVIQKNGSGRVVRVLKDGQAEERRVTVGIRGDLGMVEVLEGISAGETVVTSVREAK